MRRNLIVFFWVVFVACILFAEQAEKNSTRKSMNGGYDFSVFKNVVITGVNLTALNDEQLSVLYALARYCQAMTDADIDTMRELVAEDMIFRHMSGTRQTREEYFSDVASGRLNYFSIGIANPVIEVNGDKAKITYTSVLDANAYGTKGTYRMGGTRYFEKRNGAWVAVNR